MTLVSVSELKASFSALLRRVEAGEEVLVTERGRLIARLSPPVPPRTVTQSLREMERHGLVIKGMLEERAELR